jgi:hypothetical protein
MSTLNADAYLLPKYATRTQRGAAQNKIDGPPRTLTESPTHLSPTIRLFFFLTFFLSTFLGVSRQGQGEFSKNTIKMFLQKVHVETFFKNFDKKIRWQFFLDFFCFIAFSGVSR